MATDERVANLVAMGFNADKASTALDATDGNMRTAIELLMGNNYLPASASAAASSSASGPAAAAAAASHAAVDHTKATRRMLSALRTAFHASGRLAGESGQMPQLWVFLPADWEHLWSRLLNGEMKDLREAPTRNGKPKSCR